MRLVALIGLFLIGCQAPDAAEGPSPGRLDESLQPAFVELKAALDEGADDVARAILARLRPRCQDALSAQVIEGYERILVGRAIRDAVEARLLIAEVEGGFEPTLTLMQQEYQGLALTPGYLRVEWTAWSIDTLGRQSAQVGGRVVNVPDPWVLHSGELFELRLGVDAPRIGEGALAVRLEWKVSLGAGSATIAGARYPAQGLRVEDGVIVRLAKELPTGAVEPSELFRYALTDTVMKAALLERAVRVHPSRYEEALDLLAEMEPDFSPASMSVLVPVMAWLTGTSGISASGEEWRAWLRERLLTKEAGGNLDLPDASGR
ncbi:MAG: hypothetical protein CL933_06665 [Deltaproteobacteria bacterium]|nr:hypothetical protein [Deltaproteobacteria bacterium]